MRIIFTQTDKLLTEEEAEETCGEWTVWFCCSSLQVSFQKREVKCTALSCEEEEFCVEGTAGQTSPFSSRSISGHLAELCVQSRPSHAAQNRGNWAQVSVSWIHFYYRDNNTLLFKRLGSISGLYFCGHALGSNADRHDRLQKWVQTWGKQ